MLPFVAAMSERGSNSRQGRHHNQGIKVRIHLVKRPPSPRGPEPSNLISSERRRFGGLCFAGGCQQWTWRPDYTKSCCQWKEKSMCLKRSTTGSNDNRERRNKSSWPFPPG